MTKEIQTTVQEVIEVAEIVLAPEVYLRFTIRDLNTIIADHSRVSKLLPNATKREVIAVQLRSMGMTTAYRDEQTAIGVTCHSQVENLLNRRK
jgi:hypothetical protein